MNDFRRISVRLTKLIVWAVASLLLAQRAMATPFDADIEYSTLSQQVGAGLLRGDFGALESIAEKLRVQKERFADGRWKLTAFYEGMHPKDAPASTWSTYANQLKRWTARSGAQSPTPHVALASFYVSRAWRERGYGYAREVTPQGRQAFGENLDLAQDELTQSAPISKRCPHWFNVMQEVALGQGWSTQKYEVLFDEAVSREPTYYFYYFSKANFYQSRWYGGRSELQNFVDDSVARTYKSEGFTLYARIYWSAEREFEGAMFAPGNVDWTKMKAGFEFMNEHYPNSNWNMNALAHFACLAHDRTTTTRALKAIGEQIAYGAWRSADEVEKCKLWASAGV